MSFEFKGLAVGHKVIVVLQCTCPGRSVAFFHDISDLLAVFIVDRQVSKLGNTIIFCLFCLNGVTSRIAICICFKDLYRESFNLNIRTVYCLLNLYFLIQINIVESERLGCIRNRDFRKGQLLAGIIVIGNGIRSVNFSIICIGKALVFSTRIGRVRIQIVGRSRRLSDIVGTGFQTQGSGCLIGQVNSTN